MFSIRMTTGVFSTLKNDAGIISSSNAHFFRQKVENAPMWVVMKVKICCLHCLGNHEAQLSFLSKQKLLLTFSCFLCSLWVLNLNFPFFLTCRSPIHINTVYLISLIEDTSIFRFVYSTFLPFLESRII